MKARLIYETVNFHRGQDPKSALNIGLAPIILEKWNKLQLEPGIGSINLEKSGTGKWDLVIFIGYPNNREEVFTYVKNHFGEYIDPNYRIKSGELLTRIRPEYIKPFIEAYNMRYPDYTIEISV
jgi:hypothetical protein